MVLFVFISILLKKRGMDENVSYLYKGWKCVTFHNVQTEEREKVANAIGGYLAVTFGKNENECCSFRTTSPFSS